MLPRRFRVLGRCASCGPGRSSAVFRGEGDGDPSLAEILVSNLLDNAIRHNVPGGHIQITTGTRDNRATLTIANTGPHVPADQARRLLEPFFQRLDGKRGHDHEGRGLGLSIVAAIADAHEATLSVRPRPSGGLVIEVAFCRAADSCWPHSREAEAGPAVTRTSDRVTGVISGPPR
jgi:signal transduction histidine kinase